MRLIGLAGWSGAGKTTLLCKLIPALTAQGLRVSTCKHAHHAFDVDVPGKDSYEHRLAGAGEVLVASSTRWALIHEHRGEHRGDAEPSLLALLAKLEPVDLVIIEGWKREPHPKIEVFRAANQQSPLHPSDRSIVAVASDVPFFGVPTIDLNDVAAIARCVVAHAVSV